MLFANMDNKSVRLGPLVPMILEVRGIDVPSPSTSCSHFTPLFCRAIRHKAFAIS